MPSWRATCDSDCPLRRTNATASERNAGGHGGWAFFVCFNSMSMGS
jgi:hypothetical protein